MPSPDRSTRWLHEELIARAHRKPLEPTDKIGHGDEVWVDLVAFQDGALVPFSAASGRYVVASSDAAEGQLERALVGASVGDELTATLELPLDHPLPEQRGQRARFAIRVVEAATVTALDLRTREEAMQELLEGVRMRAERDRLRELTEQAVDDLLASQPVDVPEDSIDDELRERWRESEGRFLQELGLDAEMRMAAQRAWLEHPPFRADAKRRIALTTLLADLIQSEKLSLEPGEREEVLAAAADATGTTLAELRNELRNSPSEAEELEARLLYLKALQRILEGPPGTAPPSPRSE